MKKKNMDKLMDGKFYVPFKDGVHSDKKKFVNGFIQTDIAAHRRCYGKRRVRVCVQTAEWVDNTD